MSEIHLKVQNLSWAFQDSFSLNNLSFELQKGCRVGIIGPNGAGKSTLIRLILKLLSPPENTVLWRDRDILTMNPQEMAQRMAYVPQMNSNTGFFSVEEILRMGRYYDKGGFSPEDDDLVCQYLTRMSLLPFRNRSVNSLSGGEYQRVLLARALVQQTELVVLDEPTNHLDLRYQWSILKWLQEELQQRQLSVLAVFHDINLALEFCDRILLINRGELVAFCTPHEMLQGKLLEDAFGLQFSRTVNPQTGKCYLIPAPAEEPQ